MGGNVPRKGGWNMPYSIAARPSQGVLTICVEGRWPSADPDSIIDEIFGLWKKEGRGSLLVDLRAMDDEPTISGDFWLAKAFAERGYHSVGGIAVLDRVERKDANDFFSLASWNRGLRFCFFYESEREALEWLRSSGEDG